MDLFVERVESPMGPLLIGAVEQGLCLLEYGAPKNLLGGTSQAAARLERLAARLGVALHPGTHPHLRSIRRELEAYFAGRLRDFTVPLVHPGTPFQERVWKGLLRIPYGTTRSYAELARAVGKPLAHRAVGTANGSNRIAIVIPCHRVVNSDGKLGGYSAGLPRKEFLLDLERRHRR